MRAMPGLWMALALVLGLSGCLSPSDARPGLWLSGETAAVPADWSFSDAHPEIALELHAPYGLPHSVTIWCASQGGRLYVAARSPESKRWPGWADRRPEVRLRIDGKLYDVRLERAEDPAEIEHVRRAYAAKYQLQDPPAPESPPIRYWRVLPRG